MERHIREDMCSKVSGQGVEELGIIIESLDDIQLKQLYVKWQQLQAGCGIAIVKSLGFKETIKQDRLNIVTFRDTYNIADLRPPTLGEYLVLEALQAEGTNIRNLKLMKRLGSFVFLKRK